VGLFGRSDGARLFERTGHRNYLRTLADEAGQSI
jgi:hypothetical protein